MNSYTYKVESVSQVIHFLIQKLGPIAEELNCTEYLQHCENIADSPSWAERQRAILEETGDPAEIVRRLSTKAVSVRPLMQ